MAAFTDRRYLVPGVLNDEYIAWHVTAASQNEA